MSIIKRYLESNRAKTNELHIVPGDNMNFFLIETPKKNKSEYLKIEKTLNKFFNKKYKTKNV